MRDDKLLRMARLRMAGADLVHVPKSSCVRRGKGLSPLMIYAAVLARRSVAVRQREPRAVADDKPAVALLERRAVAVPLERLVAAPDDKPPPAAMPGDKSSPAGTPDGKPSSAAARGRPGSAAAGNGD
jgi:hypothetical protein